MRGELPEILRLLQLEAGSWQRGVAHALLAIGAAAGALSLGGAAAALALRLNTAGPALGRLCRYAATAFGAGVVPATLGRTGSPLAPLIICLLCLAVAAQLATRWIRRSEITPAHAA